MLLKSNSDFNDQINRNFVSSYILKLGSSRILLRTTDYSGYGAWIWLDLMSERLDWIICKMALLEKLEV